MKRFSRGFFQILFLGVISVAGIGSGSFVLGDELNEKQDTLEALKEKQAAYEKIISLKKNQENLLKTQITTISQQTEKLSGNIDENKTKLEETVRKIGLLGTQIAEKEVVIAQQKELLANFIRSFYDSGAGELPVMAFAEETNGNPFSSGDQSSQFQEKVSEALQKIEDVRKTLDKDKQALDQNKNETESLTAKLEQQTVYLESTKKQKEVLTMQTVAEKNQYQKKLSNVEQEIQDVEQEIWQLEAEKTSNLNLSTLPGKSGVGMINPVTKVVITQGYGMTAFAKRGAYGGGPHNGVDFGVSTGTDVFSVANGTVVATGDSGRYAFGKWVAIDHGNGLVTLYGHFSKQKVSKGASVKQGDVIGLSGNTGYSTGPHLHFSVFSAGSFEVVNSTKKAGVKIPTGAHVNPMKYLP